MVVTKGTGDEYEVVITQEDGKWKVYNTDERASLIGVVSCFDSEAEACEDFIKKLRLQKRHFELEKILRERRFVSTGEIQSSDSNSDGDN